MPHTLLLAAALSIRGREIAGETPSRPIDIDALSNSRSAQSNNAEVVARYLAQSKGRSLAEQEICTLVSLLRSPTNDQAHPPRNLELSPAPSPSALRAAAPLPFSFATPPTPASANPFDFSSLNNNSHPQTHQQEPPKPKRTIPRNPNAPTYKFTGADSARQNAAPRPRTRYASPAFGSPATSRTSTGTGIALSPPPVQKGDAKRRKLEERAAGTGSAPSSPVKSTVNGSPAKKDDGKGKEKEKDDEPQMPATPRPRHAVAVVRAGMGAPAVPSPLRNGWHASPDSSPGSPSSAKKPVNGANGNGNGISGLGMLSTPNKTRPSPSVNGNGSPARSLSGDGEEKKRATPTKAAATLSALIAETAPPPPPRPEVANPYQAALPARIQQKRPPRKRKAEAISKEKSGSEDEKKDGEGKKDGKKEEEIGLDRIIEATAPKGARRARPPPDLAAPKQPSSTSQPEPRRSARLKSPEPSIPASKQTYPSLFEPANKDGAKEKPKPNGTPVVEEVEDDDIEVIEASPPKKANTSAFGSGASSFGAGAPKSGGFGGLGNGLPSSKPSSFSFPAAPATDSISVEEVTTPTSAPSLVAKPTEVIEPEDAAKPKESGAGKNKPPAFAPRAPSKLRFATVADEEKEAEDAEGKMEGVQSEEKDKPPAPVVFFDAKLFANTVASAAASSSAVEKAKDPKAAAAALAVPASSLPTFAFRVVAAPVPITPSTSGSMDIDAPVKDDKAKESARKVDPATLPSFSFNANLPASSPGAGPSKPPTLASTSGSFNWAASGMKPPAKDVGGWTCGVCAVSNKADASKCAACEEPAPKTSAPASGGGGFNWAAAGIKPPVADAGAWTCGVCAVSNKAGAAKCVACESDRA